MRNRVIALFLSLTLCISLLVAPSFAFVQPSEIYLEDFLYDYGISVSTFRSWYDSKLQANSGMEFPYCLAFKYVNQGNNPSIVQYWGILISNEPFSLFDNGDLGTASPGGLIYCAYGNTYYHDFSNFDVVDNTQGDTPVSFNMHMQQWGLDSLSTDWTLVYTNFPTNFCNIGVSVNLDTSYFFDGPVVDDRYLAAYNAWFNGEDFIQVEVSDDIFANYAFVTVHGYDSTYETSFYHTFRFDDFLQKGVDDDLFYFKLNPRLIPWSNFYLDSLEYVSSGDFGSLTIELPDLNYGYEPMDPDSLVNEYHYNYTSEVHYQYGSSSRYIYSMFSSKLRLNTHDPNQLYFCDDQLRCSQRFNYSTIFLPYCLTDLNIDFEDFFNECVNYYDLVVVDVDSSCFDLLYGSGSYAYLENYLYTNPSKELADWYSNHYSSALHLGYYSAFVFDPSWWTVSCNCAFYFTTSWFFKQTNFLLGDTGDVLTELSSRLFEVDGFSDKLLGNMAAWASDQTDFYNVLLPKLTPIISFCNDMTLGDYFNKIVDRLDTIVNNLDVTIDLPIDDDVAAMANAFVEFWTKMFQGASPYATAFASTLQSLVSSDPQVFSLPDDPNNIALPVFPSPSVPLLPTLTPTPVPIGG